MSRVRRAFEWTMIRVLRLRAGPPAPGLLQPGIRCEVLLMLGDNGLRGVTWSKLHPGDDPTEVFTILLGQLMQLAASAGASITLTAPDGALVPLVRPAPGAIEGQEF